MPAKLILTSFTGKNASGGVPRWVRAFMTCFPEAESYSWEDVPKTAVDFGITEWAKADILNKWLVSTGRRTKDDIVIGDGWWAGKFFPEKTVSVCHGIWSHLIKEEAGAGKPPDMPHHHEKQVKYRKRAEDTGINLVAVSKFISYQMYEQWGFDSDVINNTIDLDNFKHVGVKHKLSRPLLIHGVNDRGNKNKGWDHIQHVVDSDLDVEVLSLDEAHAKMLSTPSQVNIFATLSMADLVLIPSAFEGNSYFALETLACDVPSISYNVGLFYELYNSSPTYYTTGIILDRKKRSKEMFLKALRTFLSATKHPDALKPREVAKYYTIQNFKRQWKAYLNTRFNYKE